MKRLINTKDWGHSTYDAYLDLDGDFTLLKNKTTAVFVICIDADEKVVLMSNEPLGGHIEQGESIEEALKREALEEGGIELDKWKFFGFYELTLKENVDQIYKDKYPKVGYILFFLAKGRKTREPYGSDVKDPQSFGITSVLNSTKFPHDMLQVGLRLYPKYLSN